MASGIPRLIKFAKTMRLYRRRILAYYDYLIPTGPLEGTNNKIKTMKRQACGFGDQEFIKLKIPRLHETMYAFVGWTLKILSELLFSEIYAIMPSNRQFG